MGAMNGSPFMSVDETLTGGYWRKVSIRRY
jgi:hypothetical protein